MKKMVSLLLLLIVFVSAETSIWKISKGKKHLYLGGTVHVLRTTDYPLPEEFDHAFSKSEKLVLEIDMGLLQSPQVIAKMMLAMRCAEGETLRDILSEEVYKKLSDYVTSKGVPMAMLDGFKPSMVSLQLMGLEMQKYQIALEGVDMHFYNKAKAKDMPVQGLETVEQQISFLSNMGKDDPNGLIEKSLEDMDELEGVLDLIVSSWREGNMETLDSLMIKEMKEEYPQMYKEMMTDRNNAWYPQITQLVESDPVEMILVGAAHIVGEDGLLALLRKNGYKVRPVK